MPLTSSLSLLFLDSSQKDYRQKIYEELEKAVTHQWILSTSKVKELIGVAPRVGKDEMTFVWGSFTFTKAGKLGNQMGWVVTKTLG
jgi:hypothetical protein